MASSLFWLRVKVLGRGLGGLFADVEGEGEAGVESGGAGKQPFGVFDAGVGAESEPAEHAGHEIAGVVFLVLEAIGGLAFAKAGVPGLSPVHACVDVPTVVRGIAGVVDDVALFGGVEGFVPGVGEKDASVLSHAGGPVAFEAIEGELPGAGSVAEVGDRAGHFLGEAGVAEKGGVGVVEEAGDGGVFLVGGGCRAEGAACALEEFVGGGFGDGVELDDFVADAGGIERGVLGEKLGTGEGNFRGGGVDIGGEGRDADDGESRIGLGGHVGVVSGNEVGEGVEAKVDALFFGLIHARLIAIPAVRELVLAKVEVSPVNEGGVVVEIMESGDFSHGEGVVDGGFAEAGDDVRGGGLWRLFGPDAIDGGMGELFGDFDLADGVEGFGG